MTLEIERLEERRDLDAFDCGNEDLSTWLKVHARSATHQGTRTYVLVHKHASELIGYFALTPYLLERDDLPPRIGRGAPRRIPAILLAKLAVAEKHQGRGIGRELLIRALETMLNAARVAGGKVAVVDAIDESAAQFYRAHDFVPLPMNPLRLVWKFSSIAKALGQNWP